MALADRAKDAQLDCHSFELSNMKLCITAQSDAIVRLSFLVQDAQVDRAPEHPLLQRAVQQLEEYFSGQRMKFDLPLLLHGTEFQRTVWEELLRIPYGSTRSYGAIAACIGSPKAARAVGMACNRNPIAIVVPCHRVVGSNGTLTGYAGGLSRKQFLLELEEKTADRSNDPCTH